MLYGIKGTSMIINITTIASFSLSARKLIETCLIQPSGYLIVIVLLSRNRRFQCRIKRGSCRFTVNWFVRTAWLFRVRWGSVNIISNFFFKTKKNRRIPSRRYSTLKLCRFYRWFLHASVLDIRNHFGKWSGKMVDLSV